MSKYETAVVVSAKLEEEDRVAVIEKVKGFIERYQGTVTNVDDWGLKKLAYEIQKMSEAYYYFVHFESENSECPNDLERELRILDGVIRFLVVRKDEE
ncbi:MAG: 30S ribosomal protein S6 [Lachnospiraceae bacterium]|jgi:small subunit ribosomal protein S6